MAASAFPAAQTTAAWAALATHREEWRSESHTLRQLFASDPERFAKFSLVWGDTLIDYSKNLVTESTMSLLLALARETGVEAQRDAMFAGARVNTTEGRAVLHMALRAQSGTMSVDGVDVLPAVREVRARMSAFTRAVHSGDWLGYTGKRLTDVVNIGIGGSDLGPAMVAQALQPYAVPGVRVHFVSNVDSTHLSLVLAGLSAETTLFVVCSKTFTTQETLMNATSAREWLLATARDSAAVARHFVAVSTNPSAVTAFGIGLEQMFPFWDWVGGRYSVWSAVGLAVMLAVGPEAFDGLLAGAAAMDEHFRTAPAAENVPLVLGLLGVWYGAFFDATTHAVLPYDQLLARLPAYLQQADMESNGKRVRKDGSAVAVATGPVVFGEPGTNGQHAFYQLIHQGTHLVPCDFLAAVRPHYGLGDHHAVLLANFFAQTEALMRGKTADEVRAELRAAGVADSELEPMVPHRVFPGSRPSTSILYRTLSPHQLGSLLAMYEHKIFVQGAVWGINSFDQWGVELGKQLAKAIVPELHKSVLSVDSHDASTNGLINFFLENRDSAITLDDVVNAS